MPGLGYGRDGKALLPLRYIAGLYKDQTIAQLKANMQTQRVYPYEIYPGFHSVNEYRRQHGGWYATGEGVKSFEGEVLEADENRGTISLAFRYSEHLKFTDIGVMKGIKAEDVDRARNIKFKQRYVSRWNPSSGATHRSGIQPEFNFLLGKLERYVQRYYDAQLDFKILHTFEDQPWSFNILNI